MKFKRKSKLSFIGGALVLGLTTQGYGAGLREIIKKPSSLGSFTPISSHPFAKSNLFLGSTSLKQGPLDDVVVQSLLENQLDPRIEVRVNAQAPALNLFWDPRGEVKKYEFYLSGVRLCEYEVKASAVPGGQPLILGSIPNLEDLPLPDFSDWPSIANSLAVLQDYALSENNFENIALVDKAPCLKTIDSELRPAWLLTVRHAALLYQGLVDAQEVYLFEPRFFDVTGSAKVYPSNPSDGALQEFSLDDLTGTGTLRSKYFQAKVHSSSSEAEATASDHKFWFTPGTSAFTQTSIYTNAARTLKWFQTIGYNNFGSDPILLFAHAVLEQVGPNNALYQPGSSLGDPSIFIGDGDGKILQNLGLDGDVVSHEFGHHVVFASITSTQNESLVLHEGLADFFTFARTGNACLGESICPDQTNICYNVGQNTCLRTAENDYYLGDPSLPNEEHQRSQFISGMLWDLYKVDEIAIDDVGRLVLKAIDSLVAKSRYEHLVLGLMIADRSLFDSQYCSKIYNRAVARGLKSRLTEISCEGELPPPGGIVDPGQVGGASSSSSDSRSKNGICGVVGHSTNAHGENHLLLLLLALPLLLTFRRTKGGQKAC